MPVERLRRAPNEQEAAWTGAPQPTAAQFGAIMTWVANATVKLAARINTDPWGPVELQAIAAVHESLVGGRAEVIADFQDDRF